MNRYVVGFMFDDEMKNVVLVNKNRPAWQQGKLNGVGGKIEHGETPLAAMIREFVEEANVGCSRWDHVCTLRFPYAEVEFFAAKNTTCFSNARTRTDEEIVKIPLTQEFFMGLYPVVENIPALVELSMQRLADREAIPPVTLFRCGPSKCDHDYQGHEDVLNEEGRCVGGTTVCTKCGARAIDEAAWS